MADLSDSAENWHPWDYYI